MTRLDTLRVGAASIALLAAACGPQVAPAAAPVPEALSAKPEAAPCPDDGHRLALTQLCSARVVNDLDPAIGLATESPDGCDWKFTETPMPDPNEVIVFRALECKGVMTALEVHGGAHSAALGYAKSALYGDSALSVEPVRMFISDPADPKKVIRDLLEGVPAPERAKCDVRPVEASIGWPGDALALHSDAAERTNLPAGEPASMCGDLGRDEDTTSFWRITGGYAMFFELGQDIPDIDAGSFMIFHKGADGAWAHVE